MANVIIFIDGDNIDESYAQIIIKEAKFIGDIYEAHCFADFVEKKQSWRIAYCECGIQLHYIPGMERKKNKPDPNTSDIAMSIFATRKLYECPEVDTFIIVSNDKDFIPLAKTIREGFHKQAVIFYTQQGDKAVASYNDARLLENSNKQSSNDLTSSSEESVGADDTEIVCDTVALECPIEEESKKTKKSQDKKQVEANRETLKSEKIDEKDVELYKAITEYLKIEFDNGVSHVLLSILGSVLKELKPKRGFNKRMQELFSKYEGLSSYYELIIDGKDRIVKK